MKKKHYLIFMITLIIITYIFYHSLFISILFIPLLKPFKKIYEKYVEESRKKLLNIQFRDLLYSISASISAGRQMSEAFKEGLENMKLIYRENDPIVVELTLIIKRLYETRELENIILSDFSRKSRSEDIENFVDTYLTCRTTGGDIEKVVLKSADLIMQKIEIEKEIHMITAQKKFEAKLLSAMPIVMIVFLQIASPDYLTVMYTTAIGRIVMTLALGGILLSYYLSMKITEIKL